MRTFSIQTLGCRVNHYESEQIAGVLRARGYRQVEQGGDIRVVNTCSVTVEAAAKSRQHARRAGRVSLPVLAGNPVAIPESDSPTRPRVIVTGCWATSDREAALKLPGVDAVVGHHEDVAADLNRFLDDVEAVGGTGRDSDARTTAVTKSRATKPVNENSDGIREGVSVKSGTISLPTLTARQATHQRAFLKVQDGCDAHCTYCIIPQLRPSLFSKPVDEAVDEARAMVDAGHAEIVLTGIFLGAYGQETALRRRQGFAKQPLAELIHALCTRVPDLRRLRLSSIEPGDLTPDLVAVLRSHPQITPHFHIPLQSGSDRILRRMNRQYTRADFLALVDQLNASFDRPALTTDVITGFPGERDADFAETLDVVQRAGFIHVHAFPFSPRPGTAAARWAQDFVEPRVAQGRVRLLRETADRQSAHYREGFIGEVVEVLVEHPKDPALHHGRCERYFSVDFEATNLRPGDAVRVRVKNVRGATTYGIVI